MSASAPPRSPQASDIQALIEAARRRQRRRQRFIALCVAVVVLSAAGGSFALRRVWPGTPASTGPNTSALGRGSVSIELERPSALTLGPAGVLYIADDGHNQIIERLPNGRFRILAGTGKAGFSGDGGPAVRARIDFPRGMAVSRDGTLYFADAANNRIRAIAPDGTISTVVGNGSAGWVRSGTPAHAAPILDPNAVTFGPDHHLYIADFGDNEVLRLEGNGILTEIAGNRRYGGVYGIGRPAVGASPDAPTGLAFDRAGNLYIAGFAEKTLLLITPNGIMTLPAGIGSFYPRGNGGLVTTPEGSVLATNGQEIVRLTPHGMTPIYDFTGKSFSGITDFLPEGIAVASNGTIYTDTWLGNGWTNKTALIAIPPRGKPRVLWQG